MTTFADSRLIQRLSAPLRGVFSTADLQTALAERHPAAFGRRVHALLKERVLQRFTRGFYVAEEFELPVLSQRIAPSSCISFETVLARHLIVGPDPRRRIVATKVGRTRRYAARGLEVEHLSISEHLAFGCKTVDGIRQASAEKAVLDILYFHLRGRRCVFDIYSDLNLGKLDMERVRSYLRHYKNPKFVAFAERVLELR